MSTGRSYSSSRRDEQARQTRLSIRRAARELFAAQGVVATTIAQIAEQAGVSQATVYVAYESKAGIVSAMLEEMEESVDVGPRVAALFQEPDPRRQLELWLDAHHDLFAGGVDVLRAALQASEAQEVAVLMQRGDGNRRWVVDQLAAAWEAKGALRAGLDAKDAADRMFLLTTAEAFLAAVDTLGWSPERNRDWLIELLTRDVLA